MAQSHMNAFVEGASKLFLTPILPLLEDKTVTEIMINGHDKIFVEQRGHVTKTDIEFRDAKALEAASNLICQFVGKTLTKESPRVDARLPDGSRVHIIGPPVCQNGISVTIRRFPDKPLVGEDLIRFGAATPELLEFLKICVSMHLNIIVAGGTGSGKTSLLNVLGRFIPDTERILVIEDTAELQIMQEHVVRLEARLPDARGKGGVSIRECFHSALRMRPDRVVIGEVRGGEALDLVQAMTSGHSGALATVHASRPSDALRRLETLCLYADTGLPLAAIRTQLASAVHMVVQTERLRDGSRKIIEIAEVLPLNRDQQFETQSLFAYEIEGIDEDGKIFGAHRPQGITPTFFDYAARQGYPLDEKQFERPADAPAVPVGVA